MLTVNYQELRNAFEFVSSNASGSQYAYICRDSGIIYWISDMIELEEQVPDDVETSDRYISVPHKNDLKLGQSLALSFVGQEIPHHYNLVASFFRKRGAYRRLKELLLQDGLLERWLAFEATASDNALIEWCRDNDIDFSITE